mmetsp:Transcript_83004/g.131294  ORF Transcript_83004/g.131294 Transcript_83004/m.131294 type:complete len:272 (-) Transcript_83004:25-840(-)
MPDSVTLSASLPDSLPGPSDTIRIGAQAKIFIRQDVIELFAPAGRSTLEANRKTCEAQRNSQARIGRREHGDQIIQASLIGIQRIKITLVVFARVHNAFATSWLSTVGFHSAKTHHDQNDENGLEDVQTSTTAVAAGEAANARAIVALGPKEATAWYGQGQNERKASNQHFAIGFLKDGDRHLVFLGILGFMEFLQHIAFGQEEDHILRNHQSCSNAGQAQDPMCQGLHASVDKNHIEGIVHHDGCSRFLTERVTSTTCVDLPVATLSTEA